MKKSVLVISAFILGIVIGLTDFVYADMLSNNFSTWLLYLLVLQVGLGIGSSDNLSSIRRDITLQAFMIPLGTILGSLSFIALATLALERLSIPYGVMSRSVVRPLFRQIRNNRSHRHRIC